MKEDLGFLVLIVYVVGMVLFALLAISWHVYKREQGEDGLDNGLAEAIIIWPISLLIVAVVGFGWLLIQPAVALGKRALVRKKQALEISNIEREIDEELNH